MDLGSRLFFFCWFGRPLVRSSLLALLQLLLLLGVFLCHLLSLLLMLLLQRLLSRFISRLLRETLMILLLSGLEFLALTGLLQLEFLLLLLVFLVLPGVARDGSGDMFGWGQVPSVNSGARARGFCSWASGLGSRTSSFIRWTVDFCSWTGSLGVRASIVVRRRSRSGVNCSTFSCGYCAAVPEGAGLGGSSDGGLAVIGGGA